MSIEPITRLQRFLRVLADSSADMPEPLRNLEKCCCYACGHLDTRPELHTTLEKLIASVRDKSIVPPKPNTRLEKYVAVMAGVWDDELPEPITREDKILFEAASGEDVTLSGNPLMLENCIGGKALKALHVYGKSTQDGTPSPDNPVPIVSAGDGGSVVVKVTGKNLLVIPDIEERTEKGVTYSVKNGVIKAKGTFAGDASVWLMRSTIYLFPNTWIFNPNPIKGTEVIGCYLDLTNNVNKGFSFGSNSINTPTKLQDTVTKYSFSLLIRAKSGTTVDMEWQPQLLLSDRLLPYSPYREQLLTLPTPNGLPGIPVTSGGNYTDPSGQQWVCDEVDFGKGVKVQRVDKAAFDSTKTLAEQNAILATPIETPLTPDEITAYKALTTYAPDTVVQASDGAGLEATYKCNVRKAEKTINDLYAELTAELEA